MAKAIMIQGTASNVGKSLLVAALCRIFHEDGYSVAPFKSQNMALNSYITIDGLEIGRAQAVQAQAAEIEPSVLMNPILLKPSSDTGSQVIVNGEVLGNFSASEYYAMKKTLRPQIQKAYDTLAIQYDIIVIEGAGSPAEINLNQDDFVNMGMAKMAKAPVLLCGDIDKGGVFAALAGTLLLLNEDREKVKGLIINKFRGDIELLRPGVKQIETILNMPVLGVIPVLQVDIDDEDSLSERFNKTKIGACDIAIIHLPRVSNFTDFNALELVDDITVRYINNVNQFGNPDMLIIPGTKNTMEDLLWLRTCGLETVIKKYAANNGCIFGICGGYQMLGQRILDPNRVEHGGTMLGMGLLPEETCFAVTKTRTRISGHFGVVNGKLAELSGVKFTGYEIHMGQTQAENANANALTITEETLEFGGGQLGNIYGSYYHGIFDGEEVIKALAKCFGKKYNSIRSPQEYRREQFDLLAAGVRESLDMRMVYRILDGE